MLSVDQTLSTRNLRRIWDTQTRKGINPARQITDRSAVVPTEVTKITRAHTAIARANEALEKLKKTGTATQPQLDKAAASVTRKRELRDIAVDSYLEQVASDVNQRGFRLTTRYRYTQKKKRFYSLDDPFGTNYLLAKLLERNLRFSFDLQQRARNQVVGQLKSVLSDNFPKTVVRADVRSFFESVPHSLLKDLLRSNDALNTTTLRLITDLLRTHEKRGARGALGLPRGIGLSSFLAEAYMQPFDRRIVSLPQTIFYARYVDDIVVVFTPDEHVQLGHASYTDFLASELGDLRLALSRKTSKHYEETLRAPKESLSSFTFLGYTFKYASKKLTVGMSDARRLKLEKRVTLSVDSYLASKSLTGRSSRLIFRRLRYLTSNTRLSHNKRNALVGIRFSNTHMNALHELDRLDAFLNKELMRIPAGPIASRLARLSFKKGFEETRFVGSNISSLTEISAVWKKHA